MNTAFLFADPNLLHLESEAMINTDDAPSQRSADAIAPFAPKARENPDQNAKIIRERRCTNVLYYHDGGIPAPNQKWWQKTSDPVMSFRLQSGIVM
jgi:hypothetical protein